MENSRSHFLHVCRFCGTHLVLVRDSGLAAIALTNAASDAEDVAAQSVPLVTGSAIPEPHTLALLSFAAAWLAVRRRR